MSRSRRKPKFRPLALAVLLFTAGCSAAPLDPQAARPTFRMQAAPDAPAAPVAAAADATSQDQPSAGTSEASGALIVRFDHVLASVGKAAKRVLLATAGDVDTVLIRLTGPGVDRTEKVSAADLASGTTSYTFTGLPAVELVVTIQAFDVAGKKLAEDVRKAAVSTGMATTVDATTPIAPATSVVPAAPGAPAATAGSGSGGGSGGSGNSGQVTGIRGAISITEPAPVRRLTPVSRHFDDLNGLDVRALALASDGALWLVTGPDARQRAWEPTIWRRALDGSFAEVPVGDSHLAFEGFSPMLRLQPDPHDGGMVIGNVHDISPSMARFEADGSVDRTAEYFLDDFNFDFGMDPLGRVWVRDPADPGHPIVWDRDAGVDQGGYRAAPGDYVHRLLFDPAGNLWLLGNSAEYVSVDGREQLRSLRTWIRCVSPAGAVVASYEFNGVPTTDWALTSQGDLWFIADGGYALKRLSPSGGIVQTGASGAPMNRIAVGPGDEVWGYRGIPAYHYQGEPGGHRGIGSGGPDAFISRFSADGALKAYYHAGVAADLTELVVTAGGTMWAGTGLNGLLELPIDLPFAP